MPFLLVVLIVALIVWLALRTQVASITVFEYQRGLRFVRGTLRDELNAGRYWYLKGRTVIRPFDLRSTHVAIGGQEVLSKDGVAVKVNLSATLRSLSRRQSAWASCSSRWPFVI